jgi:hypothetical protein
MMNDEHRRKISEALKRYHRERGHLHAYQVGDEAHPNWKGGIKATVYQRRAFAAQGRVCQRCGATENIVVHHKDDNRWNADPGNLEVLCRGCHAKHHHGNRVPWACPVCGRVIELQPYWAARRKSCSNECRMAGRKTDGRFS